MNSKALKTTWKQRLVILFIAIALLASTISVYIMLVLSNKSSNQELAANSAEINELQQKIAAKQAELTAAEQKIASASLPRLIGQKARVKSYNATTANNNGLQTTDLEEGSGAVLAADTAYYAYYIGWCADESVFDSSFNDFAKPTALKSPLPGKNLIAGWTEGVKGMKLGGIREISIPGELAYGETREICGGKNSPLKFIVLAFDSGSEHANLSKEYEALYYNLQVLRYKNTK